MAFPPFYMHTPPYKLARQSPTRNALSSFKNWQYIIFTWVSVDDNPWGQENPTRDCHWGRWIVTQRTRLGQPGILSATLWGELSLKIQEADLNVQIPASLFYVQGQIT